MSDKCGFPTFTELLSGEKAMIKDVFSGKNTFREAVQEGSYAALFAVAWPFVAGGNKLLGCPPGSKASGGAVLDLAEPVKGYAGK